MAIVVYLTFMATKKLISEVLRASIKSDGRTGTQIAADAGVPQPVLSRFVRGKRDVTLGTADRLAVTLGLELKLKRERKGR
jgi:plasmid maintenance system antidote protein VapI